VSQKEDPLGRLEENPSPEAPSFQMWASASVLSILHKIDVRRVEADRISERNIHKAEISFTLGAMHLNVSFSLFSKTSRCYLLDMCPNVCVVPIPAEKTALEPDPVPAV
jgi:hypothetical protein